MCFYVYSVVPENIQNSPMEGIFFSKTPSLTPLKFQLSLIHFFKCVGLEEPLSPMKISSFLWGGSVCIFSGTVHFFLVDNVLLKALLKTEISSDKILDAKIDLTLISTGAMVFTLKKYSHLCLNLIVTFLHYFTRMMVVSTVTTAVSHVHNEYSSNVYS